MSQGALGNARVNQYFRKVQTFVSPVAGLRHLFLLFLIAALFSVWLVNGSSVTAEMLFQSPQSPPAEQPPAEEAPAEQPPAEQAQPPAEQAPAEQPATEPAPAEQPPAEQPPAEQPTVEQTGAESESPGFSADETSAELAAPEETSPETGRPARERETETLPDEADEGTGNFILDQAEFIDTVVVSGAYIWLCCGVSLFLVVPVFMLILYIRGRSKVVDEEDY